MPIKTIHICDRCKHEQLTDGKAVWNAPPPTDRLMRNVNVVVGHAGTRGEQIGVHAYWCEVCCLETGVVRPKEPVAKQPEPITLEDLVKEIVESVLDSRSDR